MKIEYPVVQGTDYIGLHVDDQGWYLFDDSSEYNLGDLKFHSGPVVDGIFNGMTIEVLLAACKHRLETHQDSKFACMENDVAINHIRQAIEILNQRTEERLSRDVQGTQEV